ncbi:MAG: hypothetical protein KY445_17215 [Armatimonadetes bacterium]|nr:hypothetical protein [Armatimonadota bacterium]
MNKALTQDEVLELIHQVHDEQSLARARKAVAEWLEEHPAGDSMVSVAAGSLALSGLIIEHPEKFPD